MISIFSGSIAVGGLVGGVLVSAFGSRSLADVAFVLVAVSPAVAVIARRHAFPRD